MSADRLDEIKARADAATEGPWHWREGEPTSLVHVTSPRMHPWNILKAPDWGPTLADAEFIAASREDVPWLVERVERLERWKFEACEVMSGLRELGKALGLGLGVQITGPAALAEVDRLTEEYDAILTRQSDLLTRTVNALRGNPPPLTSWSHHDIPELAAEKVSEVARLTALVQSTEDKADDYLAEIESAHAERDALHKREKSLANEVEWYKDRFPCDGVCVDAPEEACSRHGRNPADLWRIIGEVTAERDALAAQVARVEKLAAGHRCEPYYARSQCGQCGWQEQWCATCSRQMCGCATETTDQEDQS